ncbi:hypothetical protein THRCLA_10539 [Thraustotheca clavata]|uniref:Secreted protein n=1 Tax=Thraustotheca clavata TaxID=74557 RepID=A0A1V9YLD9_9STRA|nr:hypothetical protein THRCLA_10539 [Thraustotheca clavata]
MIFTTIIVLMLSLFVSTISSQPVAAIAYPGNLFFAAQSINSVVKADALQKANNQFANHVDSDSGNTAIQKLLVVDKNHANQEANSKGFQNAVAKNNALQKRDSNLAASGAVLAPWIGRQLLVQGGCVGGGCGGGCIGCGAPSSLMTAKKNLNAENAAGKTSKANSYNFV